ncbi:MAG: hypothetical protein JXA09_02455, partial [Anaerolineae bacterium]|nr:hypothetical protein [Anaerolineae bacterium]
MEHVNGKRTRLRRTITLGLVLALVAAGIALGNAYLARAWAPESAGAVASAALVENDELGGAAQVGAEPNTCIDDVTGRKNNCTANDVNLAILLNNQPASCTPGEMVELDLTALLNATSAERWDIGMFVAEDGGDARTGACYRDWLHPVSADNSDYDPIGGAGPFYNAEVTEDPADLCGDLEQGIDTYYDLEFIVTVPCVDTDGDGLLDVGTCVSWDNSASDGTTQKPSCMGLEDTVPSTPAKCRCDRVTVGNVIVPKIIQVYKELIPSDDPGLFTLQIDGTPTSTGTDVGDGGTTGPISVTAGIHTVSEIAGTATNLADYDTSIECTGTVQASCTNCTSLDVTVPQAQTYISCTITNQRRTYPPAITVTKTADPTSVPEPGGSVLFIVEVVNNSASDAILDSLIDDVYGDLSTQGTCGAIIGQTLLANAGNTLSCSFTGTVSGNAGEIHTDTVTATASNAAGSATDSDSADVTITDVPSAIEVLKTADPTAVDEPGGDVTFTVVVNNLSAVDTVTITSLIDTVYGDLNGQGDCSVPQVLA